MHLRHPITRQGLHSRAQALAQALGIGARPFNERPAWCTVAGLRLTGQVARECSPACKVVQVLESPKPLARISRDISHARFLPSSGALATFCHVVG